MRLHTFRLTTLLALAMAACAPAETELPPAVTPTDDPTLNVYEPLDARLIKLRGVNWDPAFVSYSAVHGGTAPAGFSHTNVENLYAGISGPLAANRFFHYQDADVELRTIAENGFNAVRYQLSHTAYVGDRGLFLSHLHDFLELADRHRLYAILVLFDTSGADAGNPVVAPYDDIYGKRRTPTSAQLASESAMAQFWDEPLGARAYIEDVAQLAKTAPATFIYDVLATPGTLKPIEGQFVLNALALIKQLSPDQRTTVGVTGIYDDAAILRDVASSPNLDVASIQPWGIFRQNILDWYGRARLLFRRINEHSPLPIIAASVALPEFFQNYEHRMPLCREIGMGFFLYRAMTGPDLLPYDAKLGGIFYGDGTIRNRTAAEAARAMALDDGVNPALLGNIVEKPSTDPTAVEFGSIPEGYGGAPAFLQTLRNWRQERLTLDPNNHLDPLGIHFQLRGLGNVRHGLTTFESFNNGNNPYLSQAESDELRAMAQRLGDYPWNGQCNTTIAPCAGINELTAAYPRAPNGPQPPELGQYAVCSTGVGDTCSRDWSYYNEEIASWGEWMHDKITREGLVP